MSPSPTVKAAEELQRQLRSSATGRESQAGGVCLREAGGDAEQTTGDLNFPPFLAASDRTLHIQHDAPVLLHRKTKTEQSESEPQRERELGADAAGRMRTLCPI